MDNRFERTETALGIEAVQKLRGTAVIVFGLGGVGSHTAEALARSGVGRIGLVDGDRVSLSNINRQLIALTSTVGHGKTSVMAGRIKDINPECIVEEYPLFYACDSADKIDLYRFDYIVDAIDTVSSKLLLIERAKNADVPIISCMGTGNKLNPFMFKIGDIYETKICPLARVMRRELKKRDVTSLKVLYSEELTAGGRTIPSEGGRNIPGSLSFVPPVAGYMIAGVVIKDLIKDWL